MPLLLFIMRRWVSTVHWWSIGWLGPRGVGKITTEHCPTTHNQSIDPKQTKKHKKNGNTGQESRFFVQVDVEAVTPQGVEA